MAVEVQQVALAWKTVRNVISIEVLAKLSTIVGVRARRLQKKPLKTEKWRWRALTPEEF